MGDSTDAAAANFDGKPYTTGQRLSELSGYACSGWAKVPDSSSPWVAIFCMRAQRAPAP